MTDQAITRPLTVLIAAMGGEGGGVLMNWIVNAANRKGLPVQATSIPGVAQRTGATTYYVEIWPEVLAEDAPRPIFALSPSIGEIDVMITTELAEGARALMGGFITPDRTTLIGSTHRVFLTVEKMAMGDGRLDEKKIFSALKERAKEAILYDAAEVALEKGTIINAVMLGSLAGCGRLPLTTEDLTQAIEAEGKAVKPNLAGFQAGLEMAKAGGGGLTADPAKRRLETPSDNKLEDTIAGDYPAEAQDFLIHGVRRLTDFQNRDYATRYLERMSQFAKADPRLCREVARHLAVRMSFEDIIRVAQAKARTSRTARIQGELNAEQSDPFHVTEFFKPGIREICDLLPPGLANSVLGWAGRTGRLDRVHWGMEVRTTTITGFLKIQFLSSLRWWRPKSHRWAVEQETIEAWLNLVRRAAEKDTGVALEVAELARLIKGYGKTHLRGSGSYKRIVEELVTPLLEQAGLPADAAGQIAKAREAALADPDGTSLEGALAAGPAAEKLAAE